MDVQAAPPPFAAMNSGQAPTGNPPVLGQQVPGRSGGLPAQAGLSVLANPMAEQLRSYGRGDDTMLVHMTPNEVNSLQGLAMAAGGSLTINPHTGLPEAGWLGRLLPTILGAIATPLTGGLINPLTASALIGAGTGIVTGDLGKGLMAGLQAYGGAALGSAAGLNAGSFGIGQAAKTATDVAGAAGAAAPTAGATGTAGKLAGQMADKVLSPVNNMMAGAGIQPVATQAAQQAAQQAAAKTGIAGFAQRFGQAAKAGLPGGTPGFIAKQAPMLAGLGVLSGVSSATTPTPGYATADGRIDNSYQGPYTAQPRKIVANVTTEDILKGNGGQQKWFDVDMPEVYDMQGRVVQPGSQTAPGTMIYQNVLNQNVKKGQPMYSQVGRPYMPYPMGGQSGFAKGGEVELADGAFVVDARTVSELGNGSSGAGQELLARMGGRPVRGPGDGVSDSVPARIGRNQPARVARDEVVFSPEAVRRIGKGNAKKGAQKLYALMEKAHKARKKSARGKDTKLRKGLA